MIDAIAKKTVKWLFGSGAISEEETELYEFAVFSLLVEGVPLVLSIVIGILLGMIKEALLMIIPFMAIRKYSGGVHHNSPTACFFTSVLLLSGMMCVTKMAVNNGSIIFFSVLVCLSSIQIILCGPIDSNNRRLSEKERGLFKKRTVTILVVVIGIYVMCCLMDKFEYAAFIGAGILITGILQIPCIFKAGLKKEHIYKDQK